MTAILNEVTHMEHPTIKYIKYLTWLTAGITTVCPRYIINYTSFKRSITNIIPNTIVFNFSIDPDDQDIEINVQINLDTGVADILYDNDTTIAVFITGDDISVIFEHINLKFRDAVIGNYIVYNITNQQRKKLDKFVSKFK